VKARIALGLVCAAAALPACSRTYHPDFHPESSYSYVQNVTYAQNAYVVTPRHPAQEARPPPSPVRGDVSSPGGMVIYGDFYGSVYLGR
jgi:hypothetical protein